MRIVFYSATALGLALASGALAGESPVIRPNAVVTPPISAPATTAPAGAAGGGGGTSSPSTAPVPAAVASFNVSTMSPPQLAQASVQVQQLLASGTLSPQQQQVLQGQLTQMQDALGE